MATTREYYTVDAVRSGVTVLGNKSELSVTAAQKTIQQNEIGEIPEIPDRSASFLVLARNHNVIGSILYDCRRKSRKVYFVQTSSSAYSNKKKGIECLQNPVKKDSIDVSNGKAIIDYYTDFLSGKVEKYYIYATTDCSRSTKNLMMFTSWIFGNSVLTPAATM